MMFETTNGNLASLARAFAKAGMSVALAARLSAKLDEFVRAIEGRPNAVPNVEDGLETQRVLEAIGYVA